MGNKCKICGYRFRSKDEAICPECFTARDDDISCERYSASEHSHGRSYGGGLHETGESFVQKEMREERRNSFARENFGARANAGLDLSDDGSRFDQQSRFVRNDYNYGSANQYQQAMPQQSAYQRYIAQQQRKAGTASGYSSQTSGFTPAGQILAQRNPMRLGPQAYTPINTQRKKSSAGAVTFLVMFVFIAVAAITISNIRDRQEERERESYNYTYTYTTREKTTKKLNNEDKAKNNVFSAKVMSYSFFDVDESNISAKEWSDLTSRATTSSKDESPWKVATFTVRISCGEGFTEENKKNLRMVSSYLYCFNDNNTTSVQTSSSSVLANQKIEFKDGSYYTDVTVRLLMEKNAKFGTFSFYLSGTKVSDRYAFNLKFG
ncbi:MAG: hypothetical protein II722_03330 [Ruminococcus sp.]|nr:hypothetical protein [Ruminococcus sp.]